MSKVLRLVKLVIWGLMGAAVVQELRTPPGKRKWHGTLGGMVPYDFRPPSAEKIRRAWWDPAGPLITQNAFGVGWAINFARVLQMMNVNV